MLQLLLNRIYSGSCFFKYEVKYLYLLVVSLYYLGAQDSVGLDVLGEDFAVPADVGEFDFDHFFLAVSKVD
jgi:hypothetical protein